MAKARIAAKKKAAEIKPESGTRKQARRITVPKTVTENQGPIPGCLEQALRIEYPKRVGQEFSYPAGAYSRLARHGPKKGA